MSTESPPSPFNFTLERRTALTLLIGIGSALAGIVLFDVYQDWAVEEKPLWSTLAENALPFTLSMSIPVAAWRISRNEKGAYYLSAATKWTVIGSVSTLVVAGFVLGFHAFQGGVKPIVFITQMVTAGALAGFLVGCGLVEIQQSQNQPVGTMDGVYTPFRQIQISRTVALAVIYVMGGLLMSVILLDVYQDWIPQGNPLWSTMAENAVPLLLAAVLPFFGWRLARADGMDTYLSEGAKWTLLGSAGILAISGIVVGFQVIQGEIKPGVILTQLAAYGAVSGLFVGYSVAQVKDIRDELQRREQRLRALANSIPGGVFQFEVHPDGERSFTFVSEQSEDLLGISSDPDGYFERYIERVPSPYREELLESIEGAVAEGEPWSFEMPFERPDGRQIWVRGLSTPQRETLPGGNEKLVYHGVTIDVTEREKAEQKLRRSRKRLETAQRIAGLGSWERNPETGAVWWSEEMYDIFGWDPDEEVTPQRVEEALPPDDREQLRRRRQQALEEDGTYRMEHRVVRPDGEERLVQRRGKIERGEPGGPPRIVGTALDVTEQRHREQKVERLRQKYEGLLEGAPDAIFVAESDTGYIVEANDAAASLVSAPVEEIVGRRFTSLGPPDAGDKYRRLLRRASQGEAPETISAFEDGAQIRLATDDGTEVPVEVSLTSIALGGQEFVVGIFRDIGARRERQRRYEAIFNQTFQFTGLMEPDGTLIEANNAALSVADLEKEDVLGRPVWEAYWFQTGTETRERLRAAVEQAAEGEFVRYEETIQSADGPRVIDFSIRPLVDDRGEVDLLIPEGRDITDRKEMERAAQRRADAMEAAAHGMAILDADGRYTYVNPAHAEIYGYEAPEALVGEPWTRCYNEEECRRFQDDILPFVEEEGMWKGEATGQRADGSLFPQELTLTTLPDGGLICVVQDVTRRKARERELRQRGAAIEQAGEAVLITAAGEEGVSSRPIVYVNEAFEDMTGYTEREALGEDPSILQGPETDPSVIGSLREALEAGDEWQGETVNYRKDGTPYHVSWSVTPVRDEDGTIRRWVSVQRNVTEQRRQEEELRQAKQTAQEASRLKSAMLANLSHEFRTPLTSIIGFAEAIADEVDGEDAEIIEHFSEMIENSGRRLMDTLSSVVKLSKLQAGETNLEIQSVRLSEVMQDAAQVVRPDAEAAELTFQVEPPSEPLWAQADPDACQIVLNNLLSNAVKFTKPGGKIALQAFHQDASAVLEVKDTGIGMDPEEVEKLFKAFKQESEGLGREYEGSGLGLTVARSLLEKMGGQVSVETAEGEGARFIVQLPLAEQQPDVPAEGRERPPTERPTSSEHGT